MTLREKQEAMLYDLLYERVTAIIAGNAAWEQRLDTKIRELREAMKQ